MRSGFGPEGCEPPGVLDRLVISSERSDPEREEDVESLELFDASVVLASSSLFLRNGLTAV